LIVGSYKGFHPKKKAVAGSHGILSDLVDRLHFSLVWGIKIGHKTPGGVLIVSSSCLGK